MLTFKSRTDCAHWLTLASPLGDLSCIVGNRKAHITGRCFGMSGMFAVTWYDQADLVTPTVCVFD